MADAACQPKPKARYPLRGGGLNIDNFIEGDTTHGLLTTVQVREACLDRSGIGRYDRVVAIQEITDDGAGGDYVTVTAYRIVDGKIEISATWRDNGRYTADLNYRVTCEER